MTRIKFSIIVFFLGWTSCKDYGRQEFSLTIDHYAGAAGGLINYSIDNNGLKVNTNCDLADCKEATVFTRTFTKTESDSIIAILNSLMLDTLKKSYKYQGSYDDGYFTEIKLRKGLFSIQKSTFENLSTPTLDSLNTFIDKLVTKPEFRLASWGQSK
jgi:hypothetical protein